MRNIRHRADACDISQEIVDMIIDQLAGDFCSLKACAQLCSVWRPRSQHHMFKTIEFNDARVGGCSLRRWSGVFPIDGGDTPARFTQELRLTQQSGIWLRPRILDSHLQQLSSFSNIQKLVITNLVVSAFEPGTLPTYFGLVFPLVLHLRLLYPVGCPSSLLHFISAFPKVANLEVQHPRWIGPVGGDHPGPMRWVDGGNCISGALYLRGFGPKSDEFISLLAEQPIKPRQIHLLECEPSGGPVIQKLLDAASTTLSTLQVVPSVNGLRLALCTALKGLAINLEDGTGLEDVAAVLNSIISEITVLALEFGGKVETGAPNDVRSASPLEGVEILDRPLSRLARRVLWETGKRLTLILIGDDPLDLLERLPDFREVGNTWKGERVIGGHRTDHLWSFLAAAESEQLEIDDSVLTCVRM